jgi:hypothetical protein
MMTKLLSVFLLVLATQFCFSQHVVKGIVLDEFKQPIPGVRVSVTNTSYGVPTNFNGNYFLEIDSSKTVILKFSMSGFEDLIDTLHFKEDKILTHNVILLKGAKSLNSVEIYANKKDIAHEVIQHVMDNREKWKEQYESYSCDTYIKTSLEEEKKYVPDDDTTFVKTDTVEVVKRERMNFIETFSQTRFYQKDLYLENVYAFQDYADKKSGGSSVSVSFSSSSELAPAQNIAHNPYIFFEKVKDGDINLYEQLIELPKILNNPIVSPFAFNAFINYKFSLSAVFMEDGQKVYDINVEPRFKMAPLFSGHLYIIDSVWVVKSFDLSLDKHTMNFLQTFRVNQDFDLIEEKWVPTRREFDFTIKNIGEMVIGNTRVHHENYAFDIPEVSRSESNIVMEYEPDAFDKDSSYWEQARPIVLKDEEMKYIEEQDSIAAVLTSDTYIDSVNAAYNKIKFWDIALNGVGFRNRVKKQEIYINPIISQVIPLGMGGYRHKLGGSYSKEFQNAQAIRVGGEIDYGFNNEDLKGELSVRYTFLPKRFGSFEIAGGDVYDFVTMEQSIEDFFSVSNQVRKTFISLSQRLELVNGLYGRLSYDYSTRRDISGIDFPGWVDTLVELGIWNYPNPYETYTVSIFELEFLYRFKQSYILKGNKKLIIGTEYPELRFTYKKGIPGMFNSDVDFDFIEIGLSDKVQLGTFGDLKWRLEMGSFISGNKEEIQFIERKFIRGSDLFFFSNPLNTFQLIDSTFNTTSPYFQAFAIHHFKGAIMNKIPLINKLKLELVGGASALLFSEGNYVHAELYAGIARQFKIRQQLFKASVFYVVRQNNAASVSLNFKIGFDFFNTYTNQWSY